jgi:pimeloyl-ACP methyl ester carboxylesterase
MFPLLAAALLLSVAPSPAPPGAPFGTPALPAPDRSGIAAVNGIGMFYAIYGAGRGEPILLIHGGLADAGVWTAEIADLSRDHEVIVADSRGHGRSTRTDERLGYDLMTADYVALLDVLDTGPVTLVGSSDGGIIGLDMAMAHPEKLRRVIAQAANARPDGLSGAMAAATAADDGAAFEAEVARMWRTEPTWSDADLRRISVPTTIAIGDHDEAITMEHTEYLARTIPGARLVVLRGVGHFAMSEDPALYVRMIREAMRD